jgi:SAM-dependent methyltransferase
MSRDVLLYGMSRSISAAELMAWKDHTPGLHDFVPDFHRLQLEYWIWAHREQLGSQILDVGVVTPRRWLGEGYLTFGERDEDQTGDLLALPFPDAAFDGVLLTEVLEHCTDPLRAIGQVFRVLKPGGLLLVTSPYIWPEHGIEGQYRDYWRFTRHGWELLLAAFTKVEIAPCAWTPEAAAAYDIMRRFECFGFDNQTQATTGYLCRATKPDPSRFGPPAGRGMPIAFDEDVP